MAPSTMGATGFVQNRKDLLLDSEPFVTQICFIKLPFLTCVTLRVLHGPSKVQSKEWILF